MYPKLRCPKCGRRVAPFWFDAEWARALALGAGEVVAWVVAAAVVVAGFLLSVWVLLALLSVAVLLVIPSVYWRVIARGRFYCARCDTVLPRERLYPRESVAQTNGDAAS
jgi:hypothetical protein